MAMSKGSIRYEKLANLCSTIIIEYAIFKIILTRSMYAQLNANVLNTNVAFDLEFNAS